GVARTLSAALGCRDFRLPLPDGTPAARLVPRAGCAAGWLHEKTPLTCSDRTLERTSSMARDRTLARVRGRVRRGARRHRIEAAPERRHRRVGTRREHDE